jgi:hypothetical protein
MYVHPWLIGLESPEKESHTDPSKGSYPPYQLNLARAVNHVVIFFPYQKLFLTFE